jgi:hypothetical protein
MPQRDDGVGVRLPGDRQIGEARAPALGRGQSPSVRTSSARVAEIEKFDASSVTVSTELVSSKKFRRRLPMRKTIERQSVRVSPGFNNRSGASRPPLQGSEAEKPENPLLLLRLGGRCRVEAQSLPKFDDLFVRNGKVVYCSAKITLGLFELLLRIARQFLVRHLTPIVLFSVCRNAAISITVRNDCLPQIRSFDVLSDLSLT